MEWTWVIGLSTAGFLAISGWLLRTVITHTARLDDLEDHLRANGDGWLRDKVDRVQAEAQKAQHDVNNVKQVLLNAGKLGVGDDWRFKR